MHTWWSVQTERSTQTLLPPLVPTMSHKLAALVLIGHY